MPSSIDSFQTACPMISSAQLQALRARADEVTAQAIGALISAGQTLALAESCTGGLCAALLTDVAGASAALVSSAVVYQTRAKSSLLGLDPAFIARFGPVSEPVTRALAQAARDKAGADLGAAITGWAGPSGGSASEPVGTAYVAIAWQGAEQLTRLWIEGDRAAVRWGAALFAIEAIRRKASALSR
ncbi:MAG: CinA family protein [Myxococcales bacterium]|jgi:PncC family amidohydrolase|nr:CinA family protein [Myxococcales bacterium]